MKRWDVRTCVVCGQTGFRLPAHERRRYNCSNATFDEGQGPSAVCWSQRFPNCGESLLAALPPVAIRTVKARDGYAGIVKAMEDAAVLFEAGQLTPELAGGFVATHGVRRLRWLVRRIGTNTPIAIALSSLLPAAPPKADSTEHEPDVIRRNGREPDPIRVNALTALPADFADALQQWRETCHRIQQIKQERGVKNADNTMRRSIRDAEWLCGFLARISLQHWEQVAARHYLLFRLEHGLSIAASAFPFLKFVKSRYPRMTAVFRRPVMPKLPVTERLTERDRVVKAIQAATDAGDDATALLLCFIGLYAQPLTHCRKLAVGDFRLREGKVECKFHELWMPLDRVTVALLTRHLANLGCSETALADRSEADVCLFGLTNDTWSLRVRKYILVPIPKLRLTAVANVIAQGVLDRNGIHRAFGVSPPTIADVERIFGWQLQSEVSREVRAHRRQLLNGEVTQS